MECFIRYIFCYGCWRSFNTEIECYYYYESLDPYDTFDFDRTLENIWDTVEEAVEFYFKYFRV